MTSTFCDPALKIDRRSPGKLPAWIAGAVAAACLITFIAVTLGIDLLCRQLGSGDELDMFRYVLVYGVAFWIFASWLPPAKLSRALRVAVLLPLLHGLVIGLAWPVWTSLARFVDAGGAVSELGTRFPIALAAGGALAVFATFAACVARPRSGEWVHGLLMLALSELLLLGLWLPISCALWPGGQGDWWSASDPLVSDVTARVVLSVAPPAIIAFAFTATALRRPRWLLARRSVVAQVVGVTFALACMVRMNASAREMVLYSNLLPMLLAATIVAIAALLVFGGATWWRAHRMRRRFMARPRIDGVVVVDGEGPAIGLEITSWLRGPRLVQRRFAVSTARGTIPISGAHLIATLPAATTQLETGECIAVVKPGEHVMIAGHGVAGGAPFRTSAALLADDVFVSPSERARDGFANVALAMWRPCVAYLLIAVAIALPALAAVTTGS